MYWCSQGYGAGLLPIARIRNARRSSVHSWACSACSFSHSLFLRSLSPLVGYRLRLARRRWANERPTSRFLTRPVNPSLFRNSCQHQLTAVHRKACCWFFTEATGDRHATPSYGALKRAWTSSTQQAFVRLRSASTVRKCHAAFRKRLVTVFPFFRMRMRR